MDLPGEIELQDGVYEVGREEPADVVIPVPTVSGRHALLRISKSGCHHPTDVSAVPTDRTGSLLQNSYLPLDGSASGQWHLITTCTA